MNFMIYIFPLVLLQVGSPYALKAECDVKINDPVMLGMEANHKHTHVTYKKLFGN